MTEKNPFDTISTLSTGYGEVKYYSLERLGKSVGVDISSLPFSMRILLENALRNMDSPHVNEEDVLTLARWKPSVSDASEIPYKPARVILQDFTGVPCVADLAAMRSVVERMGGDTERINPLVPVDLVIDHSVQVDFFGTPEAFGKNVEREYERNLERYAFLRWAQKAFDKFRVVPPGTGIVHQVNLECLARVVLLTETDGEMTAYPDTLVGTDSHTTMINGLGVLGWGVGGIEAEACMLGQPLYMLVPEVVGFKLTGSLGEGVTATDLVLTVTQMLRQKGVVGKFVEFFGAGLNRLGLADRATVANMAPEYGATMGFFPLDGETLRYLSGTGREKMHVELVELYSRAQSLFRADEAPDPLYSSLLELDMGDVEPSVAGPSRPQDRVPLRELKSSYGALIRERNGSEQEINRAVSVDLGGKKVQVKNGSVVIAAITSCTNTSNPSVMIGAGLLAKKAVEAGLRVSPAVKTSLAPGSAVVTEYLTSSGLMPYLEKLGFDLVGYGCTTCIGNSGPLPEPVERAVRDGDLTVAAVLSGNRNFEGRIQPLVKLSYLASPPLVVVYALVGTIDIDVVNDPLGKGRDGGDVYLRDIWPTHDEIKSTMEKTLNPEIFRERYSEVFGGDERWRALRVPEGSLYEWDPESTYLREPPFFKDFGLDAPPLEDIKGARMLALLGDSVTTDHISPAGAIPKDGPAGKYLIQRGVSRREFNSFGSRRGNHEVMIRGTFANIRIKNFMASGTEGGWTKLQPDGQVMSIYDAAQAYKERGTPLIVVGGKEYGSGSSRDWAAKGTMLLGVKAVIAESFERIHRSNLVGMGVLPLQFAEGENGGTWKMDGTEEFSIDGIARGLEPKKRLTVLMKRSGGSLEKIEVICRLDSPVEVDYFTNSGILQTVLRDMLRSNGGE